MALIKIGEVDLPAPSKYRVPEYDLDSSDSSRNELGIMQRDRIRQGVTKIEAGWKAITSDKLAIIQDATQPDQFEATFVTSGGYITRTMYAGDRNINMVLYDEDYDKIRWDVDCNFVEY